MRTTVGIDVGGTHTDFVLIGEEDGRIIATTKVPSTPTAPVDGILQGLGELTNYEEIATYVNGTTIATNALLQRKLPTVALITTKGFRDMLMMRRETKANIYDLFWDKPAPLVQRRHIFEVDERLDYQGNVLRPLSLANLPAIVDRLRQGGIRHIAVCLMHAYANNRHEVAVRESLTGLYPEAQVTLSSEIWPEWREFERTYNTVLNTVLTPVLSSYLQSLMGKVAADKDSRSVFIMQASGGILGAEEVVRRPVLTLLSGTAGGAIGGAYLAHRSGFDKVITFDMGGTSSDMCIVEKGVPTMTSELFLEWEGALGFSAVDVESIGAGGGSIAWCDEVGALHVGPQSAGADPGPACYGKGGSQPTVTDAHVHLGYLSADAFLGGKFKLDPARAQDVLSTLGDTVGLSSLELALGALRIVNANMLNALQHVSIEKGYDPRDFALVCFGGAGPLHAAALIKELGIPKALIPIHPGNVSAFGMVAARPTAEASRTFYAPVSTADRAALEELFKILEQRAIQQLVNSGLKSEDITTARSLDMRYQGQTHEINVVLDSQSSLDRDGARRHIAELFDAEHKRRYTYANPGEPAMIVHVRVTARGQERRLALERLPKSDTIPGSAQRGKRMAYFEVDGKPTPTSVAIFWRPALAWGNRISGPAVIEEPGSTTLVPAGFVVSVDEVGNMIMEGLS
jgi:N-methylhydantoinase A